MARCDHSCRGRFRTTLSARRCRLVRAGDDRPDRGSASRRLLLPSCPSPIWGRGRSSSTRSRPAPALRLKALSCTAEAYGRSTSSTSRHRWETRGPRLGGRRPGPARHAPGGRDAEPRERPRALRAGPRRGEDPRDRPDRRGAAACPTSGQRDHVTRRCAHWRVAGSRVPPHPPRAWTTSPPRNTSKPTTRRSTESRNAQDRQRTGGASGCPRRGRRRGGRCPHPSRRLTWGPLRVMACECRGGARSLKPSAALLLEHRGAHEGVLPQHMQPSTKKTASGAMPSYTYPLRAPLLGAYVLTVTPTRQTAAPITS